VPSEACNIFLDPPAIPLAHFDDYSWRVFIALVWPAKIGSDGLPERGSPDPGLMLESASQQHTVEGPVTVFETFKADWETFQGPNKPSPWEQYDDKSACPQAKRGDFILAQISKFGDAAALNEARVQGAASVLVSQNGQFVRYLLAYNKEEFNKIRDNSWFLLSKVTEDADAGRLAFDPGSISVKSSWIDMTNVPHPERFHTRTAWLLDPFSRGPCKKMTVGLVGLHIVQKTPRRAQWIWSTFEHVDNVPPPGYAPPLPKPKPRASFTFNDGTGKPMPRTTPGKYRYGNVIAAGKPPLPVNILRLNPINSDIDNQVPDRSTTETNFLWRRALHDQNSVWQYYQLVMTQWPIGRADSGENPHVPGTPGHTLPGSIFDKSAFANTTLETWPQTDINHGCMNCHTGAQRSSGEFVWSLLLKSWSGVVPERRSLLPSIMYLQNLLREE
jgi:hypothetical protein